MTKSITITIDMDNAAFEDNELGEIRAVLNKMLARYDFGAALNGGTIRLFDSNGNACGDADIDVEIDE